MQAHRYEGDERSSQPADDLYSFAQAYLTRRGLQTDEPTVQLVQQAARKYRARSPAPWGELERFVDRVLTPRGAGPL